MIMDQPVVVNLNTYVTNSNVGKVLREKYFRELTINEELGLNKPIAIMYYTLELDESILSKERKLIDKLIEYQARYNKEYKDYKAKREANPLIQYYHGRPGTKLEDCIKECIHNARLDILEAERLNLPWASIVFVMKFNGIEYPFNPMLSSVYSELLRTIKKELNIRKNNKLN